MAAAGAKREPSSTSRMASGVSSCLKPARAGRALNSASSAAGLASAPSSTRVALTRRLRTGASTHFVRIQPVCIRATLRQRMTWHALSSLYSAWRCCCAGCCGAAGCGGSGGARSLPSRRAQDSALDSACRSLIAVTPHALS
eukprot:6732102-Prymnesium_polylepis.1